MIKNILILVLGYFVWLAYFDKAHSANQENQYCNIETTLIRTVDENGNTINEKNEEVVKCDLPNVPENIPFENVYKHYRKWYADVMDEFVAS